MIKSEILLEISSLLNQDLTAYQQDLASLQQDLESDTKSSAGDKYETSREMAQQEIQKIQTQFKQLQQTYNQLLQIIASPNTSTGKMLQTNMGIIFIGIPFKRVTLNNGDTVITTGVETLTIIREIN